jgi:hypothetical protein
MIVLKLTQPMFRTKCSNILTLKERAGKEGREGKGREGEGVWASSLDLNI